MTTIIIELPGFLRIEARREERRSSPPPPIDANGEEVPGSSPGLVKCADCNVVPLRRTGS